MYYALVNVRRMPNLDAEQGITSQLSIYSENYERKMLGISLKHEVPYSKQSERGLLNARDIAMHVLRNGVSK